MKTKLILITTLITIHAPLFANKIGHTILAAGTGALSALAIENRKKLCTQIATNYDQIVIESKQLADATKEKLAQYEIANKISQAITSVSTQQEQTPVTPDADTNTDNADQEENNGK